MIDHAFFAPLFRRGGEALAVRTSQAVAAACRVAVSTRSRLKRHQGRVGSSNARLDRTKSAEN
jgi:hypothetical protein